MADPYRSNGSAAYDVRRRNTAQPLEQPERLPDAPARHKPGAPCPCTSGYLAPDGARRGRRPC